VFLILQFDKQQRRKVKKILNQTSDVQPLLMMQCLGQKLNKIHTVLTTNGYNRNDVKQEIEAQLQQLTNDYNCGRISIQTYNNKLSELLERVGVR